MKVLLAPQAFKETLSVFDVLSCMAEGVREAAPDALVRAAPMADGGDGTLDVLVALLNGQYRTGRVTGPLGRPVDARWAIADDGKMALIEAAQACGLWRVPTGRRDPLRATSRGVGELIRLAIDAGCLNIILTLGGTATMDCGLGMLSALGLQPLDLWERPLGDQARSLPDLGRLDITNMDDRLPGVRMVALTDVRTQLDEAPALFGPQKGADVTQVELLRRGFARFGVQAGLQFGRDIRSAPGSGAAGGLGAAVQVLGADVVEGAQFVMTMQNLRESIAQADLVITGEGSFDRQSRAGKGTGAVLAAASDAKIPAAVVAARADSPAARPRGTFLGVFGAVPDGKRMDGRAIQAATREAVLASLRKRPSRASSPASAPVPSTPSEPARPPRG